MKLILLGLLLSATYQLSAQTCYTLGPRNNGNGQSNTCGSPNCSGNAKTGHFDVVFATLPSPLPTIELISVSPPPAPSPFCFDPGALQSGTTVRYCFRGSNLPSSGFMTLRFTQGASVYNCSYDVTGGSGTVLPVQLGYFNTSLQSNSVVLKWRTEQEFNNKEFEIERSNDDRTFTGIKTVVSQGNSSLPANYEYKDLSPLKGVSYYRLKQTDIDGHFTYSLVKRVDNRIQGIQIRQLFPNPATDKINLELIADKPMTVHESIYSVTGKKVSEEKKILHTGEQNWQLNISHLSSGIYEIVIDGGNGARIIEKLIKQ